MKYTLQIEKAAQKLLARIPQPYQDRIINMIFALAMDPRPVNVCKLSGRDAWRIRVGDYRVIYEINDRQLTVLVVSLGHRKEIYRN